MALAIPSIPLLYFLFKILLHHLVHFKEDFLETIGSLFYTTVTDRAITQKYVKMWILTGSFLIFVFATLANALSTTLLTPNSSSISSSNLAYKSIHNDISIIQQYLYRLATSTKQICCYQSRTCLPKIASQLFFGRPQMERENILHPQLTINKTAIYKNFMCLSVPYQCDGPVVERLPYNR